MAYLSLSRNDLNVLEKIKDPEADPTSAIQTDPNLPRDPHITNASTYEMIASKERDIVLGMQQLELQLGNLRPKTIADPVAWYRQQLSKLGDLIEEHPNYASARNNRVQALRRLHGDGMLVEGGSTQCLCQNPSMEERKRAAITVLEDLEASIRLLLPLSPASSISPQAARTLSMAYTQRAAIYHATAKLVLSHNLSVPENRPESGWTSMDFEEAASRDFAMGAKYGNEIAKGLAVGVNPTAKLCGQMVREAMKKEYGPAFVSR